MNRKNRNDPRTNRKTITRQQKWEEKHLYGYFKQQTSKISHEKILTWLRKGHLKKETESLLIATQNNVTRTNNIQAKIDKPQQNSKYRLCGDRDETINYIISKFCKSVQKEYESRLNWMGKVIHRELYKKFEIDHTNKRYMHKAESLLENEMHTLSWDFEI